MKLFSLINKGVHGFLGVWMVLVGCVDGISWM